MSRYWNDFLDCNTKKNELYHYGILGQKWGIRRYQNRDGSLTEAGKQRYAVYKDTNTRTSAEFNKNYSKAEKKLNKLNPSKDYFEDAIDFYDHEIQDLYIDVHNNAVNRNQNLKQNANILSKEEYANAYNDIERQYNSEYAKVQHLESEADKKFKWLTKKSKNSAISLQRDPW